MTETRSEIDLQDLEKLLRRVEARADQEGWHVDTGKPVLLLVYEHSDEQFTYHATRLLAGAGEPIRHGRYTAQPMLGDLFFAMAHQSAGFQPTKALWKWAFNFSYADIEIMRQDEGARLADSQEAFRMMLSQPVVIGFAFRCEAYHVVTNVRDDDTHLYDYMGDHPHAQESRVLMMVDVQDRVHQITRPRGEPTSIDMDSQFQGTVAGSLRILTDMVMDRLPQDQAEFDWRYRDISPFEGPGNTDPAVL